LGKRLNLLENALSSLCAEKGPQLRGLGQKRVARLLRRGYAWLLGEVLLSQSCCVLLGYCWVIVPQGLGAGFYIRNPLQEIRHLLAWWRWVSRHLNPGTE
jgi:hypothetical protein